MEQKNATIIFDHSQQTPESLLEAIEDMGFESSLSESSIATPVSTDTQLVPTPGLTAAAQQEALEKLSHVQGVLDVRGNLAQAGVTVTFLPSLTSTQQLSETVASVMPLEIPTPSSPMQKGPTLSPSHSTGTGVVLLKLCIEGMTCHSCTTTIEGKIGKLKGIEKIKGDMLDLFYNTVSTISDVLIQLVHNWNAYLTVHMCYCI